MDNELLRFARLAIATARRVVPPRLSKHADPTYRPASLLAALLLREHLRLTYRGVEDLLGLSDRLRRLFGLRIVPDHSTLWWFGRRRLSPDLHRGRARGDRRARRGQAPGPRLVALDSTGLWLAHTSRCFEWRAKRGRGQRGWLKWALALWVEPQMLLAQRVRPGPAATSATSSRSRPRPRRAALRAARRRRGLRQRAQPPLLPRGPGRATA